MSAGDFEIAQLDGNLKVTLTEGTGTDVNNETRKVSLETGVLLVDASVSLTDQHAYRLNGEGGNDFYSDLSTDGTHGDSPNVVDNWFVKELGTGEGLKKYYAAVTWSMTIEYTFASEKGDMGIYLDLSKSSFEDTEGTAGRTGTGNSSEGFRMMFVSGSNKTVWGNHTPVEASAWQSQTYPAKSYVINDNKIYYSEAGVAEAKASFDTDDGWVEQPYASTLGGNVDKFNLRCVSGKTSSSLTYYQESVEVDPNTEDDNDPRVKGNYVVSDSTYTRWADGEGNPYKAERIATITKPAENASKVKTVDVNCYAWFEGEDPNIVNGTAMKAVKASMTFYARSDSVA